VVGTNEGAVESFALADGLSVAEFDKRLHATLARLGIDVAIRETPFGVPTTTPFPEDTEHASYDRDAVERFWRILDWTDGVFEEFAGWYCGKTSPVHLFWHSFDLAVTRFGGRRAPALPDAERVAAPTSQVPRGPRNSDTSTPRSPASWSISEISASVSIMTPLPWLTRCTGTSSR
jgi:hypothetical protein